MAFCQFPMPLVGPPSPAIQRHLEPVHDIGVLRGNLVPIPIQNLAVGSGNHGRHGKVAVIRDRWRNERSDIELLALGFPLRFELSPCQPAANVFFSVKENDQSGQASEAEKESFEIAPTGKTADQKSYQDCRRQGDTNEEPPGPGGGTTVGIRRWSGREQSGLVPPGWRLPPPSQPASASLSAGVSKCSPSVH